ncbi:MAG: MFS transporter [Xanthomonadales bacterium]|nr:MFS transporter [Xanthomonadales bacterium]
MGPPAAGILSRKVLAAYAAPAFSQALIHGPVGTVIQGIYGKHFGVALASIAMVLVVSRIFDAITDPIIGYLSDRYRTRWGRRKPWLVSGSLVAVVACWYLYVPPETVSGTYFLVWFLLAYLGWTISEIPYRAWMAELTEDYNERTRIAVWRTFARYLGFMAFYGIPLLPFFETSEFTPETLRVTAVLAAIALPTTALIAALVVPEGTVGRATQSMSLRAALPAVVRNKPLMLFLATFATGGLATGMAFGMLFFFVDVHLSLGGTLALLFVLGGPIGAAAMPFWGWLARRIGKQRTWAVAYAASASFLLLHLLIPAGPDGKFWLIAGFVMVFAVSSVGVVVPAALLADLVDYGRWKFKADYAGSYFSIQTMVEKGVEGLGVALGLAIASWFGFDPQLSEQSERGTMGLLLAFPILPSLLTYLTVPIIWKFPIDERRQKIIVRRLARLESRG